MSQIRRNFHRGTAGSLQMRIPRLRRLWRALQIRRNIQRGTVGASQIRRTEFGSVTESKTAKKYPASATVAVLLDLRSSASDSQPRPIPNKNRRRGQFLSGADSSGSAPAKCETVRALPTSAHTSSGAAAAKGETVRCTAMPTRIQNLAQPGGWRGGAEYDADERDSGGASGSGQPGLRGRNRLKDFALLGVTRLHRGPRGGNCRKDFAHTGMDRPKN